MQKERANFPAETLSERSGRTNDIIKIKVCLETVN